MKKCKTCGHEKYTRDEEIFYAINIELFMIKQRIQEVYGLTWTGAKKAVDEAIKIIYSAKWNFDGKCELCKIKINEKNTGLVGWHEKRKNKVLGYCCKCIDKVNKGKK